MRKYINLPIWMLLLMTSIIACKKEAPPPGIPQSVKASTNFALKVEVTWTAASNSKSYNIYRADYGSDTTALAFTQIGTSENTSFTDLDVMSDTRYYYKVEASNGSVTGGKSALALGQTKRITADEAYDLLAELTGGIRYDASRASEVPDIIIKVISENATVGTDLVFLIDNTGSMGDDIYEVKKALNNIITKLPASTMLGAATYNDANEVPTMWFQWQNLTSEYSIVSEFINDISVYGGGDLAESVYDGLYETIVNMSWSSTRKRMIIIIGDAPPLEGRLTKYSIKEVAQKCNEMGVAANLYPILIK